jgi:lysozyme
VGRCLDRVGISDAEISFLLDNDIESVFLQLTNAKPEWQYYPFNVRVVLCDMAFNLGVKGLSKFRNMWRCLAEADYIGAAEELMDSKYAEQVPNRAKRNAKLLREVQE